VKIEVWHVRLLGALEARRGEGPHAEVVTRFRMQKAGAILAYLALFSQRNHTREALATLFWPEAELEAGRANLRTALAILRRQLEGPSVPDGSVLVTDGRQNIALNPEGITTDVAEFERSLRAARRDADPATQITHLTTAVAAYGGPLLPGYYEEWALNERERLATAYRDALRRLTILHQENGDTDTALQMVRRAVTEDPMDEEARADLLRLLVATGQTAAANREFEEYSSLLKERLDTEPPRELRAILSASPSTFATTSRRADTRPTPDDAEKAVSRPEPTPAAQIHLPLTLTRFFGRESELATLRDWLGGREGLGSGEAIPPSAPNPSPRLITLTGPGGSGKTRLAIEAARAAVEAFPSGVYFVPLADVRDAELLPRTVADVLRLPPSPTAQPIDQIRLHFSLPGMQNRPALLILDNFEQLVDDGARIVRTLLDEVPALTLLVTSRRRLLVESEREMPVNPLPAPEGMTGTDSPDRLLAFPSVQLFVSRAQAARPDFQLRERNASTIGEICTLLEGIPLAIELAASWAQTVTPTQMKERLTSPDRKARHDILVARRRDIAPRHATLWSTVSWSYDQLPEGIQQFFARLSAFRGGWTLEAAEAVCDDPDALFALTELRERSLIQAATMDEGEDETEGDGETLRFRMLETLREFASEQLSVEETVTRSERHALYFLEWAETVNGEMLSPRQMGGVRRLDRDRENLRAALHWCFDRPERKPLGWRFVSALGLFWEIRSYLNEGLAAAHFLMDGDDGTPDPTLSRDDAFARARTFEIAGRLSFCRGDIVASRQFYELALPQYEAIGEAVGVVHCYNGMGIAAQWRGEAEESERLYREGIARAEVAGDRETLAHLLANLAMLRGHLGDAAGSFPLLERAYRIIREFGDTYYQAIISGIYGLNRLQRGEPTAVLHLRDAVSSALTMDCWWFIPYFLVVLAFLTLQAGDPERAARLLGVAEGIRRITGGIIPEAGLTLYETCITTVRATLGESRYETLFAEGMAVPREDIGPFALDETIARLGAAQTTT
jgi:predicted ATPase/DNA-binding SARP family transcriptional activator